MMDHMRDVKFLLDYLRIGSLRYYGVSGGGVYVLCAAFLFPKNRLLKSAIMAGNTHPDYEETLIRTSWKLQYWCMKASPLLYERWCEYKSYFPFIPNKDVTVEENIQKYLQNAEFKKSGYAGYINDLNLGRTRWDFNWRT